MRRIFTLALVFTGILTLTQLKPAQASHIAGMDLTYRCLGTNPVTGQDTMLFFLNVYRDCDGITVSTSQSLTLSAPSCGFQQTIQLNFDSVTEVTPICALGLVSNCTNGTVPGVQQYAFSVPVVLPQCPDWTVSWSNCCRNPAITNLNNPGGASSYISTTFNNQAFPCNSSPRFTTLPVPYICANTPINYNHGTIDPDGDSLVYLPIDPLNGPNTPIAHVPPFSATQPLTGTYTVDTANGQIFINASANQVVTIALEVREYRNGVLIGTVMRDIQFRVISTINGVPCNSTIPPISLDTTIGAVQVDSTSVEACPNTPMTLIVSANSLFGDTVTMTSNATIAFPGSSFNTVGFDSVTGTFNWVPTNANVGRNTLLIFVKFCSPSGLEFQQIYPITITVLEGTDAGPDIIYCAGGGPKTINVQGGNSFSWSPTTGIVSASPDSSTIQVAPPIPVGDSMMYIVTSDLDTTFCKYKDTVWVFHNLDFTWTVGAQPDTICAFASTALFALPDPNFGPYVYGWEPNTGLLVDSVPNPGARPLQTTDYVVTMTSANGCTTKDTVRVTIDGIAPKIILSSDKNDVCPGDTVQILTQVSALPCGLSNNFVPGCSFVSGQIGTQATNTNVVTPYRGSARNHRMQILYRASELQAAGMNSGSIFAVAFDVLAAPGGVNSAQYDNFTIRIGCTQLNELSSYEGGLTTVLPAQTYTVTPGTNTHNFPTSFDWDGQSNLIVEVCFTSPNFSGSDFVNYTPAFNGSVIYSSTTSTLTPGCLLNTGITISDLRPNTTFVICNSPTSNLTYTWTPTVNLSDPNIAEPTAIVNRDIQYQLVVDDGNCIGDTTIDLRVDSSYYIATHPDTGVCAGDTVSLFTNLIGDLPPAILACGTNPAGCASPNFNIGDVGTSPATITVPNPFYATWEDQRVQYLYQASELQALGFGPGSITDIALNVSSISGTDPGSFEVKVGCTSQTQLTGFITGLTSVYTATNFIPTPGWNTFNFNQTYDWDGVSNIVVEFCYNKPDWGGTCQLVYTTGPLNSVYYEYNDGSPTTCVITNPVNGVRQGNQRANTRFIICDAPPATVDYEWFPKVAIDSPFSPNPNVFPSVRTEYAVRASFINGCERWDTVIVDIGGFNYNLTAVPDTICVGDSSTLSITGGDFFSWGPAGSLTNPTSATTQAFPTTTTDYIIQATDSAGCAINDTITVAVDQQFSPNIGGDTTVCASSPVTLDAGAGYASYFWNAPGNPTTRTITVNQPGQYSVIVNNGVCDYLSNTVTISNYGTAQLPLNDETICDGQTVTLSAPAGYTAYQWSNGATSQSITVSSNPSNPYFYSVIDQNGCNAFSDTAIVSVGQTPVLSLLNDTTICNGESVTVTAGPSTGISYSWSDGQNTATATFNSSGIYTVTADNNGCTAMDSINVGVSNGPSINLGPDEINICCDQSIQLSPGPAASYTWQDGSRGSFFIINRNVGSGMYTVAAEDQLGCVARDTVYVTVNCIDPVATYDPVPVLRGDTAQLSVSDAAINPVYSWDPTTGLDNPTDPRPRAVLDSTTTFIVTVTDQGFINSNGNYCVESDTITVIVIPPTGYNIANAFTPNGDGLNDTYGPITRGETVVLSFRIYNRWGDLLHDDPDTPWDGTVNGTVQPSGTYVFYMEVELNDPNDNSVKIIQPSQGTFELIR
jgi:gliding motility-associated-like protein